MIRVDREYQIETSGGELRIVGLGQDHANVVESLLSSARAYEIVHLRVDINRVNPPARPDGAGQAKSEIAAAGAQVGDMISLPDLERGNDLFGGLPAVPVKSLIGPLFDFCATGEEKEGE